jgi:hypothetical protein
MHFVRANYEIPPDNYRQSPLWLIKMRISSTSFTSENTSGRLLGKDDQASKKLRKFKILVWASYGLPVGLPLFSA